jgi:hypothetical protein
MSQVDMKIVLENMSAEGVLDGKSIELDLSLRDNSILIETSGNDSRYVSVWIELTEGHLDLLAWDEKTVIDEDPAVMLRLLENINGESKEDGKHNDSAD